MPSEAERPIRVVVLGAGFGGVYVVRRLCELFRQNSRVEIILVNRTNYFMFTPLLHEFATGSVAADNIVEPLRKIVGRCLAAFYLGNVLYVSHVDRYVETTAGRVNYDYLVVALGATTNFYDVVGAKEHSFTLKSIEDAARLKNHLIEMVERSSRVGVGGAEALARLLTFVIVGGGPTGVELSAEISELLRNTFRRMYPVAIQKVRIVLITRSESLLPKFGAKIGKKSLEVLRAKNIDVLLNKSVEKVGADFVETSDRERLSTMTTVWVAGIRPRQIKFDVEVAKDRLDRIIVRDTLQLRNYEKIFALGDIARVNDQAGMALPALAQVASREAITVAENIKRLIQKKQPKALHYKHSGVLVSLGQWTAVAEIRGVFFWGRVAWWLWRTVYISKMISWPKKVKVAVDWTINLFMPRDTSQLPFCEKIEDFK